MAAVSKPVSLIVVLNARVECSRIDCCRHGDSGRRKGISEGARIQAYGKVVQDMFAPQINESSLHPGRDSNRPWAG
jgi:hypothetical protein